MSFNIENLSIADTAVLHLRNPATDELLFADKEENEPLEIELYSTGSKPYRSAISAMQNRELKRKQAGKKATAEQLRDEGIELLVACSIKANNLQYKCAAIDTPEAFRALYSDAKLSWIKNQVDEKIGDIASFLGK